MNKQNDFHAVIFDMDGVIFDSEKLVLECWKIVAEKHGIPDVEQTCMACLGVTREMAAKIFRERYGADFPYEEYKNEQREYFFSQPLPIKPGVRELFEAIHAHGKKMALASSTSRATVTMELETAGLLPYFDALICGDMVEHSKPHPEIYLKACETLGFSTNACYGIEDSFNGIKSIEAAGMHAIMVPDMVQPTDEIRKLCEIVLPDLTTVQEYFFGESLHLGSKKYF